MLTRQPNNHKAFKLIEMKITDLSKYRDVGASSYYIELGSFKFVLDAGFHPKKEGKEALPEFSKIVNIKLDFILLTHCHLDHLGALPILAKYNKGCPILTSIPSSVLAPRMLINSWKIMLKQRDELGLKELPLYTRADIDRVESLIFKMPYHKTRVFEKESGEKLEVTFCPSGHIPGAAGILIEYKHRSIFFTGDVLFKDLITVPGAQFPLKKLDTLVMETTRGATIRSDEKSRSAEIKRFIETINHTLTHGGACLIPIFALGRTQEVLKILEQARGEGVLVNCPIYCSGLGLDLSEYFDEISKKTGLINFRQRVLKHLKVKKIKETLHPGENVKKKGIYLLSSGMVLPHTPSYLAAASMIEHSSNSICFLGYCDSETQGGKILSSAYGSSIAFEDLNYVAQIKARVERFDLSGHADREELVEFAQKVEPRVVLLTHGEPAARNWFKEEIPLFLPHTKVIDPEPGKEILV